LEALTMGLVYLMSLLGGLACMALLDRRYRLFFWNRPAAAAAVLLIGVGFFLMWDVAGIRLDIFHRGETPIMTGVLVAPELPLEEVFFLAFLCYVTMILFTLVLTWRSSRQVPAPGQQS
jgi:lycopene cyclase domain-containing protein